MNLETTCLEVRLQFMFLSSKAAHYHVMKSYVTSAAFFSYSSYYDRIMHQSVICPRGLGLGGIGHIPWVGNLTMLCTGPRVGNILTTRFALGMKSKWSVGIIVIFILCAPTTEGDSQSNALDFTHFMLSTQVY